MVQKGSAVGNADQVCQKLFGEVDAPCPIAADVVSRQRVANLLAVSEPEDGATVFRGDTWIVHERGDRSRGQDSRDRARESKPAARHVDVHRVQLIPSVRYVGAVRATVHQGVGQESQAVSVGNADVEPGWCAVERAEAFRAGNVHRGV